MHKLVGSEVRANKGIVSDDVRKQSESVATVLRHRIEAATDVTRTLSVERHGNRVVGLDQQAAPTRIDSGHRLCRRRSRTLQHLDQLRHGRRIDFDICIKVDAWKATCLGVSDVECLDLGRGFDLDHVHRGTEALSHGSCPIIAAVAHDDDLGVIGIQAVQQLGERAPDHGFFVVSRDDDRDHGVGL